MASSFHAPPSHSMSLQASGLDWSLNTTLCAGCDRRGRYGNFGLACRALPDGHFLRHAVVLYADFRGVHDIAADLDECIEIVRGDKAGLEIGDELVG